MVKYFIKIPFFVLWSFPWKNNSFFFSPESTDPLRLASHWGSLCNDFFAIMEQHQSWWGRKQKWECLGEGPVALLSFTLTFRKMLMMMIKELAYVYCLMWAKCPALHTWFHFSLVTTQWIGHFHYFPFFR